MTVTRTWHGWLGKENAERPIPAGRVMRRSVMVIDDEESGAWSGMSNLDSENINQMVLGKMEWSEQLSYIAIDPIDELLLYMSSWSSKVLDLDSSSR